jgi:hypothetical protein
MKKFCILFLLLCSKATFSGERINIDGHQIFKTVFEDYQAFYTSDVAYRAMLAFSAGAIMAHSPIDTEFQDFYQQEIRSSFTDDFSAVSKLFGEKILMIPIAAMATSYQVVDGDAFWGKWGEMALRSYLLGSPIIGITKPLTGGSRPRDHYQDANWRPFNDDNGVSGHAFVGAVPFLTLASMPQLSKTQQTVAYIASGFTAVSRINDEAHYLSQALLGWYVAWEAVNAVNKNNHQGKWYRISPYAFGDGVGISLSVDF